MAQTVRDKVAPPPLSTIYALAAAVDARDHYTYGHLRKVSRYAVALGEALGLSRERLGILRAAGLLHDIGKIGIADETLRKPGPLSEEEWQAMKNHCTQGAAIIRHVRELASAVPAILHHHERYDGQGYPSGLRGLSIPLEARILAIVDAYDAMTSRRPYRRSLSRQEACAELAGCSGREFDSELVSVFCQLMLVAKASKEESPVD